MLSTRIPPIPFVSKAEKLERMISGNDIRVYTKNIVNN
jgi:hypothetical protein